MISLPSESTTIQKQRIALPAARFVNNPFRLIGHMSGAFLRSPSLLIGMAVLQLIWLGAILWTGTSSNVKLIVFLAVYSFFGGLIALLLPDRIFLRFTAYKNWFLQSQIRFLLLLSLTTCLVGVFYAGTQRSWGDEERSFRVAKLISAKGVEGAYQESGWLSKKHPPLVPLLYSLTVDPASASLFPLRLVSVLFLVFTSIAIYYLGSELYDRDTGSLASFLFLSFPLVIRLGTSAMMDIQLTLFFTLALLVALRLARAPSIWLAILTGLLIGLGLLTKYMMVLIFGVLILCAIFLPRIRRERKYFLLVCIVALALFSGWLLYANHIGILAGQVEKIKQFSGIYYLFDNHGEEVQIVAPAEMTTEIDNSASAIKSGIRKLGLETIFTRLPSSLGVHNLLLIVFGGMLLLKRRKQSDIFILFWIGVVFGALFLTLPDHRYFLPSFPALAIMVSQLFKRFSRYTARSVFLSFLFWIGNLYLFVNWAREAHLFL